MVVGFFGGLGRFLGRFPGARGPGWLFLRARELGRLFLGARELGRGFRSF